jgi:ribosome biogenesis GTPase
VVRQTGGGVYHVGGGPGESGVDASIRGRVKRESRRGDRVVIGDRVRVDPAGDSWTIEEVLPRRNVILRRGANALRPKAIVANVDRVVVVASAGRPTFDPQRLDRYLIIASAAEVPAVIVVNKCDLAEGAESLEEARRLYGELGYEVLGTSAEDGRGLPELRDVLRRGIAVLLGASGTGKSSLLNRIEPGLALRTGELSRKLERGKHTTVNARLIELVGGGDVADTPGFEHAGPWVIEASELDLCFPEMRAVRDACRFKECSHTHEPDCAVSRAVEEGEIAGSRYESYRRIREELEAGVRDG